MFPIPDSRSFFFCEDERLPTRISRIDGARYAQFSQPQLRHLREALERLNRGIEKVARSTEPAYEPEVVFGRRHRLKLTAEAKILWGCFTYLDVPVEALAAFELHPYLDSGIRLVSTYANPLRCLMRNNEVPACLSLEDAAIIDSLYAEIRHNCNVPQFKSRLSAIERLPNRRYDSCVRNVLRALRYHEHVDVLRLDLLLDGEALMKVDASRHKKFFGKYLNWLRDRQTIQGIIWNAGLPCADLQDGSLYRILALVDPGIPSDPSILPDALGRLWVDRCVGDDSLAGYRLHPLKLVSPHLGHANRVSRSAEWQLRALQQTLLGFCGGSDTVLPPKGSARELRSGQISLMDMSATPGMDTSRDSITLASRILRRPNAR